MAPRVGIEELAESLAFEPFEWGSFEGVVALLTERESWAQLERAYRRMLHAVVGHPESYIAGRHKADVERDLWRALATLYRDRLGDLDKAIAALELLARQSPEDAALLFDLASLYEETAQLDRAVETYEAVTRLTVAIVDAPRRLFDIHMHRGAIDAAWCAAAVLEHFDALTTDERDLFEDYAPRRVGIIAASLGEDDWPLLLHEDADPRLTELFQLTRSAPPTPADMGGLVAPRVLAFACHVFGVPYLAAPPLDPSLRMDEELDGMLVRQQLFWAGRAAATCRLGDPPPVRELKVQVLAAARLSHASVPVPSELDTEVASAADRLRSSLDGTARARVARILSDVPKMNLATWRDGVGATAMRAGLLLAGDVRVLREVLPVYPEHPGQKTLGHPTDLLAFASSMNHVKLRAVLGRAVDREGRDDEAGSVETAKAPAPPEESIEAGLCSEDATTVGAALFRLRRSGAIPDVLLPVLEELLTDRRVYTHELPQGPTYEALFELAVEALVDSGARGAPALERAALSPHQVNVPDACYDQGAYIGDYASHDVRLATVARDALRRMADTRRAAALAAAKRQDETWSKLLALPVEVTMAELERALGVAFDEPSLERGRMGRFTLQTSNGTPIAGDVVGLRAAYAWDMHHENPVASLDDLRERRVHELCADLAAGCEQLAIVLGVRFGRGWHADKWQVHGPWLIDASAAGDACTLCRYHELPDWAEKPPDAFHRANVLRDLAYDVGVAETHADLLAATSFSEDSGMRVEETSAPYVTVRFVPPMPALELAEIFGWREPVGESYVSHQQTWNLRLLDRSGATIATRPPALGTCPVTVVLSARPTGGPTPDYAGPPGGCQQFSPTDTVRSLRIGAAG